MTLLPEIEERGDQLVVNIDGAMTFQDYLAADALVEAIFARAAARPTHPSATVFELGRVTMIDSHWLGMFVRVLKRAEESRMAVILRGAQPPVRRLLDLVQFDRVFQVEP